MSARQRGRHAAGSPKLTPDEQRDVEAARALAAARGLAGNEPLILSRSPRLESQMQASTTRTPKDTAVTSSQRRQETITGLRALADFLAAHPDLPVPSVSATCFPEGTDTEQRAEVGRIAGILGERAADDSGTHYRVSKSFGGGVVCEATAIMSAHMAAYSAHMEGFYRPGRARREQRAEGQDESGTADLTGGAR